MKQMNGGMMYEQGDIVLLPFPYTDFTGAKQRPALIISNAKFNRTEDRIYCLITSNTSADGMLIRKQDCSEGLPFKSWVKPQRVFTISKRIVRKKISAVSKEFHSSVLEELNAYLR